jgi:hypothetical protein
MAERRRMDFGGDGPWLVVLAATTAIEFVWWAIAWMAGIAPLPLLPVYIGFALAALAAAIVLRWVTGRGWPSARWPAIVLATLLIALGASLFLPLKVAIPAEVPFWLDAPLAAAERAVFGGDPWRILDTGLGWAAVPLDRLYGLWLPVQSIVLFVLILAAPSAAKSRALIAYSIAWLVLGVLAAVLFSSAGPIFFDRLFGGSEFAALGDMLRARDAWMAIGESDAMWDSLASGDAVLVAGISAMPSLHVAISFWMVLTARMMAPRVLPFAAVYFILIWIASVQLGWHYVSDGLIGALGMLAIWWVAGIVERRVDAYEHH